MVRVGGELKIEQVPASECAASERRGTTTSRAQAGSEDPVDRPHAQPRPSQCNQPKSAKAAESAAPTRKTSFAIFDGSHLIPRHHRCFQCGTTWCDWDVLGAWSIVYACRGRYRLLEWAEACFRMHDDATWTNDLYTLGTAYIDGHIAYDTRLAPTRVPLVRQTAPTMRLNFRLGKPGAVLSSFLGVLDIKLGEWCA